MAGAMKGKDLLSLHDLSTQEIDLMLDTARHLKLRLKAGDRPPLLAGKVLGMIFHKPSTRTRVSFETAMFHLGGHALNLRSDELQLSRGETIADTARVLSRYVDAVMIRTYSHDDVAELARWASVPVINGLTDLLHPCQALADLLTIREVKGCLRGVKLAFVGDGNNVAHSLMYAGAKTGMKVTIASPDGYEPDAEITRSAVEDAGATGARIEIVRDPREAVSDADVVYTDVWASMGQEEEAAERRRAFAGYQVSGDLLRRAKPDAVFMHDLPAHRGEEVTDEVMDGPRSVVWQQAENRLHAQKALLALIV